MTRIDDIHLNTNVKGYSEVHPTDENYIAGMKYASIIPNTSVLGTQTRPIYHEMYIRICQFARPSPQKSPHPHICFYGWLTNCATQNSRNDSEL